MKRKLTALTLLLCSAMAATGCSSSDVEIKKDGQDYVVYSIKSGDQTINFNTSDLLKELEKTDTAKTRLYNEIARQVFTIAANNTLTQTQLDESVADARADVETFQSNARSNARDEGVDYDVYLESQLEAAGVETLRELEALYVYQNNRTKLLEDYVEDHYDYFLEKFLNLYTPFQVKHILVAANTSSTNYTEGTMSTDKARLLYSVVTRLANGENFATVADETDDTSSKDTGGILPFDQAQNYVSEFRFAPYILAVYSQETDTDRLAMAKTLKLLDEDATLEDLEELAFDSVYREGIDTINLADIKALDATVASTDKGYLANDPTVKVMDQDYEMNAEEFLDDGVTKNPSYFEEHELRRNQIFNSTVNTHQVKYIRVNTSTTDTAVNSVKVRVRGEAEPVDVLADNNGNPVYVVYASTGIHIMSNVYSYVEKGIEDAKTYYTLYNEDDKDLTKYSGTYIGQNSAYEVRNTLISNSDDLLSTIASYVSPLEQYVFFDLVYAEDSEITITFYETETDLYGLVKKYVEDRLSTTDESFEREVKTSANTYGKLLERESEAKISVGLWND